MITTERLILRPWRDEDFAPYAAMNGDPAVREFFQSVLTPEQSDAEIHYLRDSYVRDQFCFFAAELRDTRRFVGFIGMLTMSFVVPGVEQPAVEVGWRLAREFWGRGLATEGAHAVVDYAFETLHLREIVAITVPANVRSRRVMEKIGMKHMPELDFDHPRIAEGHPLRRHVLYSRTIS
jgi:3-dehydroquinate dehydratase/shikimate dehydrogenase